VSLNFLVRITGMLVLAYIGSEIGRSLSGPTPSDMQVAATRLLMLAGAGLGLIVAPRLTIDIVADLLKRLRGDTLSNILFMILGGFIGLLFGVLLAVPLVALPAPFGQFLPLLITLICIYIGTMVFFYHRREVKDWERFWGRLSRHLLPAETADNEHNAARRYLLDTSAIIDGRIAEVSKTGFLEGVLVVPRFVLIELQGLADSSDDLRRSKGRRGLELLNQMQHNEGLPIEFIEVETGHDTRVDDNLVILARQQNCPIITNDFNLNRVAGLQGVRVLSLNQLSEAVRPPVLQDQHLHVMIRNEGNARQQGVGYLDDGTPVIVEDAKHLIGQTIEVVVIRLHQTQTGRLVFAQVHKNDVHQQQHAQEVGKHK
jgi:uncharacterized protein YacL